MGNPGMPMLARLGYSTFWHSERSFDSSCQSFFQGRVLQEYLMQVMLYETLYPSILSDLCYFTYADRSVFVSLTEYQAELRELFFVDSFVAASLGTSLRFKMYLELKTSNITLFTPQLYWTGDSCVAHLRYFSSSACLDIYPIMWVSFVTGLLDQWCTLTAFNRAVRGRTVHDTKRHARRTI